MRKSALLFVPFVLFSLLVIACKGSNNGEDGNGLLVRIGGHTLSKEDLAEVMPNNLSEADSVEFAEHYIRQWIDDQLLYEVASKNVPDMDRIDKEVERYRKELITYEYRNRLVGEKAGTEFSDEDMEAYYKANPEQFRLKRAVIKGLFLKVPEKSPNIDKLKRWYSSGKPEAIENIEKKKKKNAVIYEYFYDKWVDLDEVMANIPYVMEDETSFLKNHKTLEVHDKGYWYLLHISEYRPEGGEAPFDFARTQIQDIFVNRNRLRFNREMEEELYREAMNKDKIEFFYKNPEEKK